MTRVCGRILPIGPVLGVEWGVISGLVHRVQRLSRNRFLALVGVVGAAIQLAIPYVPPIAEAFRATLLKALELALAALVAVGPAVVAEVVRSTRRTLWVA